jgi:PAS domain S-box-containing protein
MPPGAISPGQNGYEHPDAGVGLSYLAVCDAAAHVSDDARQVAEGIRAVRDACNEFYLEYPCHTRAERRWFGVRITPFSTDLEAPRRVVVAHENITARKVAELGLRASEERYRVLADSVPALVFTMEESGATYANRRWQEYSGKTINDSRGFGWQETVHPHDITRIAGEWKRVLATTGGEFRGEFRLFAPRRDVSLASVRGAAPA